MELGKIEEKDKKILENLAKEFGEDFSNRFNGNGKIIGLYGIPDSSILDFFGDKLESYLLKKGKSVRVIQNNRVLYNIDIGFFLNGSGYINGLNKDIECFYN